MPSLTGLKLSGRANVAIGVPCTEVVPRTAFQSLMFLAQTLKPGDVLLQIQETAVVAEARNTLIQQFLRLPREVQYLFLFDSDMVVPANIVDLFVGYDVPFVSAYCTRKTYPYLPIPAVLKGTRERHGETIYEYQPITDLPLDGRLHKVDGVGAAAICVRRDVLEQMEPPWFKFEGGGEDYYFCRKVQQVRTHDAPEGAWIVVDTGTQVGHINMDAIAYPSDWFAVKETYLRESGEVEHVIGADRALDLVPA